MTKQNDQIATVAQKNGFVEITFAQEVPQEIVEMQVDSCRDETCTCCTPAFREKVDDFSLVLEDNAKVQIHGTISADEVRQNMISCAPKLQDAADNAKGIY